MRARYVLAYGIAAGVIAAGAVADAIIAYRDILYVLEVLGLA